MINMADTKKPTENDIKAAAILKQAIKNHPTKKQLDVAEDLGVTPGYINHLANGRRLFTTDNLLDLSESLGMNPIDLHPDIVKKISKSLTGGDDALIEFLELIVRFDQEQRNLVLKMLKGV